MITPENTAFIFAPGSHHETDAWQETERYIREEEGFKCEIIGADFADERLDFKDYADDFIFVAKEFAQERKKTIYVPHSRSVNCAPWVLRYRNTLGAVMVCGSFQPEILKHVEGVSEKSVAELPPKYHKGFESAPIPIDNKSVVIPPEKAAYYFYHDCKKPADLAEGLKAQRVAKIPDELFKWPREKDVWFIHGNKDRVINPSYSKAVAELFGTDSIGINTGHTPMLAKPELLGQIIVSLVRS